MATLLLVAAGAALGAGRIVGAAAALLGQAIDGQIFGSRGHQEGHRLTDLRLQTSTYGTAVPRLYGAMRVAGTVIWSTDLLESVHHSGGGKRSPSVTTYSYAASFAVALSSRPIRGVGRIWMAVCCAGRRAMARPAWAAFAGARARTTRASIR